jgi:hypothetical protein
VIAIDHRSRNRRLVVAAAVALLVVSLAGVVLAFHRENQVTVEPPRPDANAAAPCQQLVNQLPETIATLTRRPTQPESPFSAAWGSPAIILRCGIPVTEQLAAGGQLLTVNGVDWSPIPLPGGYRFVTYQRIAAVEVVVPDRYSPESSVLVDLAAPVAATILSLPRQSPH